MRNQKFYNEEMIRTAIEVLKPNGELFEIRIIGKGNGKKRTISGYFTDADTLINAFDTIDPRGANIYITINKVNNDCYSREQHDCFRVTDSNTHDHEIDAYEWLFIDLDPCRLAEISSSNEELQLAKILAGKIYDFMKDFGFSEPIKAMSGNGVHLLYKVNLKADEESKKLMAKCLFVLADMWSTSQVKVDEVNHNQSRICKLYGTLAQKGANTSERPHRMSEIVSIPQKIEVNSIEILKKLAALLPDQAPAKKQKSYNAPVKEFDLVEWMQEHGLDAIEEKSNDRATIYPLKKCPFDHSHTNGDSKIFHYRDGAIAFKCHHNSCRNKTWQDVREMFEPGVYDKESFDEIDKRINDGWQKHIDIKFKAKQLTAKETKIKRKLKTAQSLMEKNLPEPKVFVGIGEEIPMLVEGTCILSSKPKLGKSWFVLAMCLAICNGEDFLGYKTNKCACVYLDLETSEQLQQKRIRKMLKGSPVPRNFYIDTSTDKLDGGFKEQIEYYLKQDPSIGVVVVDVFQMIRSASQNSKENEYEHAYRDITPLNELAKEHNISIILVCHDRKMVDIDDPFSNILGSTGLQGAVAQMMVMFRPRKNTPIHLSIKGKTIDGLIDMDISLNDAQWTVTSAKESETKQLEEEYYKSEIRNAVIAIAENGGYNGRCSGIIQEAVTLGIGLIESPKEIGSFLGRNQGRFLKEDKVAIEIAKNGSGSRVYKIIQSTVDTVDGFRPLKGSTPWE